LQSKFFPVKIPEILFSKNKKEKFGGKKNFFAKELIYLANERAAVFFLCRPGRPK
jgi:hypothetical protein